MAIAMLECLLARVSALTPRSCRTRVYACLPRDNEVLRRLVRLVGLPGKPGNVECGAVCGSNAQVVGEAPARNRGNLIAKNLRNNGYQNLSIRRLLHDVRKCVGGPECAGDRSRFRTRGR